jgi:hypothetical protein
LTSVGWSLIIEAGFSLEGNLGLLVGSSLLRLGCTENYIWVCWLVAFYLGSFVVRRKFGSVGWSLFIEAGLY